MLQGAFELQIIYTAVYTLYLCIPILYMRVLNRQECVSRTLKYIELVTPRVGEHAKLEKYVN